jgi:hypothetical protein
LNASTSKSDAELFVKLVQQYAATYRHPNLPAFNICEYSGDSIHDSVRYQDVLKPGVYALYDHEGTLIYIGESGNPSNRNWTHQSEAQKGGRRAAPRIDLVTVADAFERFSLEKFLQSRFPDYQGRWDAWVERERQHPLTQSSKPWP